MQLRMAAIEMTQNWLLIVNGQPFIAVLFGRRLSWMTLMACTTLISVG